jgi:hypothetical protein
MHPELTARGIDDRAGEPVVVRVRVRADDEPDVFEPEAGLGQSALELSERARLGHPSVDEDDPAAGGDREGVHMGHAGPRERKPKSPNSGLDSIGSAQLSLAFHPSILTPFMTWPTSPRLPRPCTRSARASAAATTRSSRTGLPRRCCAAASRSARVVQQHAGVEVPPRVERSLGAR